MKLKITFLGLFLATFLLSAQSARMNRDIEVAEKILESLFEESQDIIEEGENIFVLGNSTSVEGTYLEGFGAMFTISVGNLNMPVIWSDTKMSQFKKSSGITIVRPSGRKGQWTSKNLEDLEVSEEKIQAKFKEVVETFICDYGYLLRQLKNNEKIMIRFGKGGNFHFDWAGDFEPLAMVAGNTSSLNYSATINKSDITAFQSDQIKENQLKERIKFVFEKSKEEKEKYKDLDLLATILNKIYKKDHDKEHLYLTGTSNYEKIDGLGAIYKLRVRSGNHSFFGLSAHKNSFKWNFHNEDDCDCDEENEVKASKGATEKNNLDLDKAYAVFIETFKNSIVDYGSIVKSLDSKESLIFKLQFPKCEACSKMPKQIEITAKQSTLQAYRKDQISLEKAVSQLGVK